MSLPIFKRLDNQTGGMKRALANGAIAGVMAYVDPLAGYVPYSQAISAGVGANVYENVMLLGSKSEGDKSMAPRICWASTAGAVLGVLFIPNFLPSLDFQMGAGIGAFAGVFVADMLF